MGPNNHFSIVYLMWKPADWIAQRANQPIILYKIDTFAAKTMAVRKDAKLNNLYKCQRSVKATSNVVE